MKLFYRGELDANTGAAENGAIANKDYLRSMSEGAWANIVTTRVRAGVYCISGYSVANCTFIEGDTGLIMIDTAHNIGCGRELIRLKEAFSGKPIVAIIYSHHHYTGGAAAVLDAYPKSDIPIYGHPGIRKNIPTFYSARNLPRGMKQIGAALPHSGPDAPAIFGFKVPTFDDPGLNEPAYVPVTRPVADGEEIVIDGVRAIFHHCVADADDSLITYFPGYDLVQHNAALMPVMFPFYTLRGDAYRDTEKLIEGIDVIRRLQPEHLIGCHGWPVSGKDAVYEFATAQRDAYTYIYQEVLRGIESGLAPDDLTVSIRLPKHLAEHPSLFPAYVDVEHIVRGVYRGLIGWWANDGAELHPPAPVEYASVLIDGFGGAGKMIDAAAKARAEKKYNLAAKLLANVLAVDPDDKRARRMKAEVLRQMAYTTPTGIQTRNFLLTEALGLEGAVDASPTAGLPRLLLGRRALLRMPLEDTLRVLETSVDPVIAAELSVSITFSFDDVGRAFGLAIRRGPVELLYERPLNADVTLMLDRPSWVDILLGVKNLQQCLEDGSVRIEAVSDHIAVKVRDALVSVFGQSNDARR